MTNVLRSSLFFRVTLTRKVPLSSTTPSFKISLSLSTKMSNQTIKLMSIDDDVFEVDIKVAERSITIKTMLEDLGKDDCDEPIPLIKLSTEVLKKIIEWCTHHKDDPNDEASIKKRTDDISEWDANFFKVDDSILSQLISAANYLDIQDLVDVGCKTVANMITGRTPEELTEMYLTDEDDEDDEDDDLRN